MDHFQNVSTGRHSVTIHPGTLAQKSSSIVTASHLNTEIFREQMDDE